MCWFWSVNWCRLNIFGLWRSGLNLLCNHWLFDCLDRNWWINEIFREEHIQFRVHGKWSWLYLMRQSCHILSQKGKWEIQFVLIWSRCDLRHLLQTAFDEFIEGLLFVKRKMANILRAHLWNNACSWIHIKFKRPFHFLK